MTKKDKLQHLLISHLLDAGYLKLLLPDGVELEMGIVQESENGTLEKVDNYCWLIATREDRTVSMDSYNLGLRYSNQNEKIIFEEDITDTNGESVKVLSII